MSDAGSDMKGRLRSDLRAAFKEARMDEVRLLRALIAEIDNAEAPPTTANPDYNQHLFQEGTAEVERLALDADQLRTAVEREI